MKIKVTRKEIKEGFRKIYCCGYCDLQPLFSSSDATFYNSGVYGWNYDGVMIDVDTIILTGYRGMFGDRLPENVIILLKRQIKFIMIIILNGTRGTKKYHTIKSNL